MRSPVSITDPTSFRPECVLIAEPDLLLQHDITVALQQDGYDVSSVAHGASALEILTRAERLASEDSSVTDVWIPDLLILDTALPDMNGLDLCQQIRHQRYFLPILMTSTKSSELDRVVGLELGADDYLIKPFGIRELVARCRSLLRRHQRSARSHSGEDVLSFQDILLYPASCYVTCRGVTLSLSPKEFRILDLLIRNPRRVWSREQLLERVWGRDFVGDTKTVDVHVRWLREKLEADPSHPQYIQTVRGFGYRMG
jgi:two-component system, OmpR family, phosphate regulon response regulator PhoB